MNGFLQLHLLTNYPISNPNRDDLGRPKTAVVGGKTRLRTSSQALKRAWRTATVAERVGADSVGKRTRRFGEHLYDLMLQEGADAKKARKAASKMADRFGKLAEKEGLTTKQIAHVSPTEWEAASSLAKALATEDRQPTDAELNLLQSVARGCDIALFGRMFADSPSNNVDAAAQVAHAFSVQEISVEDDYFSAVDDLNIAEEDAGAGHIGEAQFSSGLMYKYVCVDRSLLVENLDGNEKLAEKAIRGLVEAAATVAPTGKQNSFGSRTRASYICGQRGLAQPTSLAGAFLDPVTHREASNHELGWEGAATDRLRGVRDRFAQCYGETLDTYEMSVSSGEGSLTELLDFSLGSVND